MPGSRRDIDIDEILTAIPETSTREEANMPVEDLHPRVREFIENTMLYGASPGLLEGGAYSAAFNRNAVNFLRRRHGMDEVPNSVFEGTRLMSVWVERTPYEVARPQERLPEPEIDISEFIDDIDGLNPRESRQNEILADYDGNLTAQQLVNLAFACQPGRGLQDRLEEVFNNHLLMTVGFQRYSPVFGEYRLVYLNKDLLDRSFPSQPNLIKNLMAGISLSYAKEAIIRSLQADGRMPRYSLYSCESDDPLKALYDSAFNGLEAETMPSQRRGGIEIVPYITITEQLPEKLRGFRQVASNTVRDQEPEQEQPRRSRTRRTATSRSTSARRR